jgi:adhesin transport system outer membrane protein
MTGCRTNFVLSATCALVFGAFALAAVPVCAQTSAEAQIQLRARAQAEAEAQAQTRARDEARSNAQAAAQARSEASTQVQADALAQSLADEQAAANARAQANARAIAPLDVTLPANPPPPNTSAGATVTANDYERARMPGPDGRTPDEMAFAADQDLSQLLKQSGPAVDGNVISLPLDGLASLGDDLPVQDRISLDEALDRTVNQSYSFKAVQAQAEGAGYARSAALGQLGPTLDVRTNRGREYSAPGSVIDPDTGKAVLNSTHRRWDASVIFRQPIFAPASYFEYRKQGGLARAADSRTEDAKAQLYYTTIKAYFDLLKAYALLSFAQGYENRMEQLQDYMSKRLAGGGASKIDLDRVKGRTLSAQSAVIENQGAFESTMVSLEQLTGVRANKMMLPTRIMPAVPATSRLAMEDVYVNNPGIRAAREEVAAAGNELKGARSRFSPTLAIEMSQLRYSGAGGDNTLTVDRKAMLVLSMNLLNGGSDYYYQKEIGAKFIEKSATASDTERKVKEQLEVNYRTLTAITKRTGIARQEYLTNTKVADEFLEQLSTGSKQLLDVLDAYQRAYQSRVDFAQLLFLQSDISYQILRNSGRNLSATGLEARNANRSN